MCVQLEHRPPQGSKLGKFPTTRLVELVELVELVGLVGSVGLGDEVTC